MAGALHVAPAERTAYPRGCQHATELAREADGCLDFVQAADPLDVGRINVFERWESDGQLLAFRSNGAPDAAETTPRPEIVRADVRAYRISAVEAP